MQNPRLGSHIISRQKVCRKEALNIKYLLSICQKLVLELEFIAVELRRINTDFWFKIFRKFFENLGPIKMKNKKKEESKLSLEDKIGFWLPATPPSQRTEDIFVGKKFLKDRVYYYNYWYHGNVFLRWFLDIFIIIITHNLVLWIMNSILKPPKQVKFSDDLQIA